MLTDLTPLAGFAFAWLAGMTGAVCQASLTRLPRPKTCSLLGVDVLITRPCAGTEPRLFDNLVSIADARFTFCPRVRISVCSRRDPAFTIVVRAVAELRRLGLDAEARVIEPHGLNHKTCQLAAIMDPAEQAYALNFDSDVDLSQVDLDLLVYPLSDQTAAATWMMPVETVAAQSPYIGDRASAGVLGASLHAFALLSRLDRTGFVGKAFAVSVAHLKRIGGFASLVNYLGEDTELARRLRDAGLRVIALPSTVTSTASGRSFQNVYTRFSRWLMVIRRQRPLLLWSYPLFFLSSLPLAALSLAVAWSEPITGIALLLWTLALRLWIAWLAARTSNLRYCWSGIFAAIGLGEVTLWMALVHALGRCQVCWRGRVLSVGERGQLLEDAETSVR